MPTVTLSRKVFESLVGKELSDDKLKYKISMLGTDLDSITEKEIVVEIFPNRPDMLSEQGFSRAFASFIGKKTGLKHYNVEKSGENMIVEKSVQDVRPYTACAIVKNLSFNDEKIREVIQIQDKLDITFCRNRKKAAIGIYPYEEIKPSIRFVGMKPEDIRFQPLESSKMMNGYDILEQHPTGRKYAHLLEGKKKFPVFIDSNDEILSVPPIINSDKTGRITEKTKEVFIEVSGFDFNVLNQVLNILVTALAEMGGKIYSMDVIYPNKKFTTPDLSARKMEIDLKYVNRILGLSLNESEIKKYLEMMGLGYKNKEVLVSAYRADILHQIDLIEDIAIAYGFENFREEIPKISTIGEEDDFEKFKNKIVNILVGLGLIELNTYHLSNEINQCKKMNCNIQLVELENALTADYNALRFWMIPSLLEVLSENKHHEFPQNIFDIGVIFKQGETETGVVEATRLCVLTSHKRTSFTEAKQILDHLMRLLDLKYELKDTEHASFITGRVGRVSVKGKDVAYIGEIHPQVLENFDLRMPVTALELNLTDLYKLIEK